MVPFGGSLVETWTLMDQATGLHRARSDVGTVLFYGADALPTTRGVTSYLTNVQFTATPEVALLSDAPQMLLAWYASPDQVTWTPFSFPASGATVGSAERRYVRAQAVLRQ